MVIAETTTTTSSKPALVAISLKADQKVLPHSDRSNGLVIPIQHDRRSNVDFGAEVYGIDLDKFTDADFDLIFDALHKHKLLVFKGQPKMLSPQQQYRLTSR
jgi:hypothetical protein